MIENEHFDYVMGEVRRLGSLKGWRRDAAFQSELARIAMKFGDSPMILHITVDAMVESWDHCPSPAELRTSLEKSSCAPAEDPISKWVAEFRGEVRKALHRLEKFGNGRRQGEDAESYLRYAYAQHPEIVAEETRRMSCTWRPSADDIPDALEALTGKCTAEQLARLRRQGIRDALRAVAHADENPNPHSRQFWADHLDWSLREHADEVQQIRQEPS